MDLQGAGPCTRLAEAATLERHDARPPDDAPTPDDAWTLSTWIRISPTWQEAFKAKIIHRSSLEISGTYLPSMLSKYWKSTESPAPQGYVAQMLYFKFLNEMVVATTAGM
jgi:hypothetical protein